MKDIDLNCITADIEYERTKRWHTYYFEKFDSYKRGSLIEYSKR